MPTKDQIKKLIELAKNSRNNAFAFRSRHNIGAAVLMASGQMYGGCNVENSISGLGVCAERSAIDHAIVHGQYDIDTLAVVDKKVVYPCGACLQYLTQFSQVTSKDLAIILSDLNGNYQTFTLSELLPHGFITTKHHRQLKSYSSKS